MAVTTRDRTLKPSCVWQEWGVTHWVFGTDHSSCEQHPTGLWSLLCSVLGMLLPALPWNIWTQPELNSSPVLPPLRTDVLRCFPFPSELHPKGTAKPSSQGWLWSLGQLISSTPFLEKSTKSGLNSHSHSVLTCLDLIGNFPLWNSLFISHSLLRLKG